MPDDVSPMVDPLRIELDSRSRSYVAAGRAADDHDDWTSRALSEYRDEIVHFGAQLLNDIATPTWKQADALSAHATYLSETERYDADPTAWEAAFWSQVLDGLPSSVQTKIARRVPRIR